MKLKYFVKKQRNKQFETSYYWQCKASVAEKYGVEKSISLGKDEKQALTKWHELNAKLQLHKKSLNETGMLPLNSCPGIEEGTLTHITELYFQDRRFTRLAERTKRDYKYIASKLNNEIIVNTQKIAFGKMKIVIMDRLFCKTLYEKLLPGGKRTAESFIKTLSNILNTAKDYGYIKGENPCSKMTIEKNKPRDQVWTKEEFLTFTSTAKEKGYIGLYIAINIAYYTAQRLTDIINLKWSQIDSELRSIKIQQSKTGSKVEIPLFMLKELRNRLSDIEKNSEYVVVDQTDQKPYNNRDRLFSDRFETIRKESQIRSELLFRDLRRTAILALDEAGCTPPEIASISGHSRQSIISMLEVYAPKTSQKAEDAFEKLNKKVGQAI